MQRATRSFEVAKQRNMETSASPGNVEGTRNRLKTLATLALNTVLISFSFYLGSRDGGQHRVSGDGDSGVGESRLGVSREEGRSEAHPAAADLLREMPRNKAKLHSGQRSGAQFNTAVKAFSKYLVQTGPN